MYALLSLIHFALYILIVAIFGEIILSYLDPRRNWSITALVHTITDPILNPIRRVLPSTGMFDFAPMVGLIIIYIVQGLIR